jgi:hypothetical protein
MKNNQLLILPRKNKFYAYEVEIDFEVDYDELYKKEEPKFVAKNLIEALELANKYSEDNELKHGYLFVGYNR